MFNEIKKTINWGSGTIELSTGKIARQASGAVMVKMGDSVVLCTTVTAATAKEDVNFFPLTVHYQEKSYAAGKIPGGFFKSEGKPSEKEVLTSRLIDRPIRPLFAGGFFNDTQVICTVHSYDPRYNTDILALIGASAALAISGVPYLDIVAASRVGLINGQFVLNPSVEELKNSELDLVVAGTKSSVMMVESEAKFLTEEKMLEAVKFGHNAFQPIITMIEEMVGAVGKSKWEISELFPSSLQDNIASDAASHIIEAFKIPAKPERNAAVEKIASAIIEKYTTDEQYTVLQVESAFYKVKSDILRRHTLTTRTRIDGRAPDQVRPINCEVAILPKAHGSALFTRGETQSLVTTTLGTSQDEQIIDNLDSEYKESFLLNYLFPPYSVGETSPLRAPGRREVGHGKLAWRALKCAMPSKEKFPYTVRVVSEITESNGSSSMATICGASMSMMNAGVPMQDPVAGIAMGLIKDDTNFIVLSDIIADEDSLGDMDFKVAGSKDAVTALQMDIKVEGITFDIMQEALKQAKVGRIHILDSMSKAITEPHSISDHAPIIVSFTINKDKIRDVIGPGGKVIKEICEVTGAKIDITDDGMVSISAIGRTNLEHAQQKIKDIVVDPEVGQVFEGTVVKILDAGAFVNYMQGRDGFVHISEIVHERVESVGSVLSIGQKVRVKLIGFDKGKAKLTIKNADSKEIPSDHRSSAHRGKAKKQSFSRRNINKKDDSGNQSRNEGRDSNNNVNERKYFS